MRIRYFVVDLGEQLRKAAQTVVEGLWQGKRSTADLDVQVGDELRLITVLCDDNFNPQSFYLLRIGLCAGRIPLAERQRSAQLLDAMLAGNDEHPLVVYQLTGWPRNWLSQLATALDVPVDSFGDIGVGGPLAAAESMGVSLRQVMPYFAERAA